MEVREYLAIRRAYNTIRQRCDADKRLTFSEFAIACRLSLSPEGLRTSDIAEYQGCLRPTMTHRTKHLADLGFIIRTQGNTDRRNVLCCLSDDGEEMVAKLCSQTRSELAHLLSNRPTTDHVRKYVDAMGSVDVMARDLVLLALYAELDGQATIGAIVDVLGFLQPTVSMSVSALACDGLLNRDASTRGKSSHPVSLTEEGRAEAKSLNDRIEALTPVRRARRQ